MEDWLEMESKCNEEYPRILVISSNAFSDTTNNGKTLASFFNKCPVENIAQLYFNPEVPNNNYYANYFRITDNDILKCIFRKSNTCGNLISLGVSIKKDYSKNNKTINMLKKYNLSRIAREVLWKSEKWKTKLLDQWLNDFSPEILFLCAGDGGFIYDITKYIRKKYDTKLVVYITDDYVLPRKTISPFWWLRRNYILKKMSDAVQGSDLFITISEKMRGEYKDLFRKDSILAVNMTEPLKDEAISTKDNDGLTLVYAGGLHYKRYVTLNLLAKALKKYNDNFKNRQKVFLKIFSGQKPSYKQIKYLNLDGASEYCGKLNSAELKEVLNACDLLVHVESFDRKCIEATRLSISTKIPEYLSLGKPVLAIGPQQVASMEYLKDCAFCITNSNKIYSGLIDLFNDNSLRKVLSHKAQQKYEENHKKEIIYQQFISNINNIYEKQSSIKGEII